MVLGIIEYCQNDVLHETSGLALRHLKDELSKIAWISL